MKFRSLNIFEQPELLKFKRTYILRSFQQEVNSEFPAKRLDGRENFRNLEYFFKLILFVR
ncbi:hypothetical protein APR40_12125 [Salegentibacter salarius]|uniref:Uncharacterized protein n=1 Tax=Salegentibacter salarius TaxID=435906 RepID=A0A2N0TWB6_9FLAO|nr:hypothetical protein BHS39_12155 [Salegentibacter salarius]PKD18948.1 hypothetical protein APR40_12125 [Salegentibacter salarius]